MTEFDERLHVCSRQYVASHTEPDTASETNSEIVSKLEETEHT